MIRKYLNYNSLLVTHFKTSINKTFNRLLNLLKNLIKMIFREFLNKSKKLNNEPKTTFIKYLLK